MQPNPITQTAQSPSDTPVTLLLGTYNGAAFLDAQLASLAAQRHRHWQIWVSDDGSSDETLRILQLWGNRWRGQHPMRILDGPQKGAAANYLFLLCHPDLPRQHIALCDQDDIWHPDKLCRALANLSDVPAARPAIYGAQSLHTNAALAITGRSSAPRRGTGFGNALLQNVVSGHSAVLTPAALSLIRRVGPQPEIRFHDWWLYLLISAAGGTVRIDPAATLRYRQHAQNLVGANRGVRAKAHRAGQILNGQYGTWLAGHLNLLSRLDAMLSPEARQAVAALRSAKGKLAKVQALHKAGAWRQSRPETLLVYLAALTGRL
ncbi:glycosyltransferase [Cognatishimia sp. SS12]|uniref:glycosyltransferase n=1 Tax=Cognatishimia sp. SS12 TaxID=2979465 RepID=UPI00232EB19C|nr:glycosyltransferase [Cognatishimia sp. SS12]MDC0739360.1 glycosyltransferase [Cognatishimia sp. SS12]